MAEKKQFIKIPKPADFKPKKYFPKNWKDARLRGKPRCPGWARSSGKQCGKQAGHGTDRLGEAGACCKAHGGASKGAPKGSMNALNPDGPFSKFIRLDDLPQLEQFAAMSAKERADLMANIMLLRASKNLAEEVGKSDDEVKASSALTDARLIELEKSVNRSLRTVATFLQIEKANPNGSDDNDDGSDEDRVGTAMGLFEQLTAGETGGEDS